MPRATRRGAPRGGANGTARQAARSSTRILNLAQANVTAVEAQLADAKSPLASAQRQLGDAVTEYAKAIDGVIAFLSGRYREIERELEARCRLAAEEQDYEHAALERNRLRAVQSVMERQRVANESVGTLDAVAVAVDGTDANAQVFQIRDGVLSDRQSFYLENVAEAPQGVVADGVHQPVLRRPDGGAAAGHRPARGRGRRRAGGGARRARAARASRSARPSAATSGGSSSSPSATRGSRSTGRSSRPSAGASSASRRSTGCRRRSGSTRCRCGSSASTSRTSWAPTRWRRWSSSRAARRRRPTTGASTSAATTEGVPDDFAAMEEVLGRRLAQWEAQQDLSPARPQAQRVLRDAAEPHRHRRRPGPARRPASARCGASATAAWPSSRWPSGSRRSSSRAAARRSCCRTTPPGSSCCSASATRRTASRSPTTARAATGDDDLDPRRPAGHRPGAQARAAGPLRLARGDPRARRASSSRACPGCRAETARELYAHLTRTSGRCADRAQPGDARGGRATAGSPVPRRPRRRARGPRRASPASRAPGKSTAMAVFEDAGYFCVDNLPPEMIRLARRALRPRGLEGRARRRGHRRARRRLLRGAAGRARGARRARGPPPRVFLDADEESSSPASRRRVAATRSRSGRASSSGIAAERALLEPLRELADASSTRPASSRTCCGARSPTSCCAAAARAARGELRVLRLQARARRATPTSSSTCASCPTRTTSPTCAR